MRIIVCGGRDFHDREAVFDALRKLQEKHGLIVIINGDAPGADRLAQTYATHARNCHLITEPADWKTHGKAAGPIRNQAMIDKHSPEAVVAFPGGSGTADMVKRAEAAGLKIWFPCGKPRK